MQTTVKKISAILLLMLLPVILTACSGGNVLESADETVTISGTAMKGPIKGALVEVFTVKSDGTPGVKIGSSTSGDNGSYSITVLKKHAVPPLLIKVSGQNGATYLSETTNQQVPFSSSESFRAMVDAVDSAKSYAVTPITDASYQQLQRLVTQTPTLEVDTKAISAANARVATLFNISDVLADPSTDSKYTTALKVVDQMVVNDASGSTLQTMGLINQAFTNVQDKNYQNYRNALQAAATQVTVREPAISNTVNAMVSNAVTPPQEPAWNDTTAPDAVTNLKAFPVAENAAAAAAELVWSPSATSGSNPVAGYDIYRNGVKVASVSSNGYIDKPLLFAASYQYEVVAFDIAGNRSLSGNKVTVTTPNIPNLTINVGGQLTENVLSHDFKDINPPAAPSNLSAKLIAVTSSTSSIELSWSAPSDNVAVTGYDVYRDGAKVDTVSTVTYTDQSLAVGATYKYKIIAFDDAGNKSAASTEISVTPTANSLQITVGGAVQ